MTDAAKGQVNTGAAKVYEQFFVPALFAEWAPRVLDALSVESGDRILDVACGTGVVARHARNRHPSATVVGLDPNLGMLTVAHERCPEVTWTQGVAEDIPFPDQSFDRVACQFGLMFFSDRDAAIREMLRVTKPGGKLAFVVWASLEDTPGYSDVTRLLHDVIGDEAANAMRAPFCLGDVEKLGSIFDSAGATNREIQTVTGKARFESLDQWMYTDIRGWTLADMIDDDQFERLREQGRERLAKFVLPDGTVEFDAPAHLVTVTKAT